MALDNVDIVASVLVGSALEDVVLAPIVEPVPDAVVAVTVVVDRGATVFVVTVMSFSFSRTDPDPDGICVGLGVSVGVAVDTVAAVGVSTLAAVVDASVLALAL